MPKSAGKKLLLYYSVAASMFLTLSGFFSVKEIKNASFQLIFLPVTMYLFLTFSSELKSKLLNQSESEVDHPPKKRTYRIPIFFIGLYLILVAFGLFNISNFSRGDEISQSAGSSPLIFKDVPQKIVAVVITKEDQEVQILNDTTSDAKVVLIISETQEFEVVEELDEWYKIKLEEDSFGFVNKSQAELRND